MKPQRFRIGQDVTPKRDDKWYTLNDNILENHPKFGEVYRVTEYNGFRYNHWFIRVVGPGNLDPDMRYCEEAFDPVISTAILANELTQIEIEQTK